MGFLDEGHRCPGGIWSRVSKALLTVIVGALIGITVVYVIQERAVPAVWLAAAALGAVLAMSVRQAVVR